jgi:hypothetical protein
MITWFPVEELLLELELLLEGLFELVGEEVIGLPYHVVS